MRRSILAVGLCFLALSALYSISLADPAPKGFEIFNRGVVAPKTIFFDGNGAPTTIGQFNGKIAVLNLWATWCVPCAKEMPSLERLSVRLPSEAFVVVAVSQDKGGTAISKPFLDRIGMRSLAVYADPTGRLYRDLGGRGIPATFIVGQNGDLVARFEGAAEWDEPGIVDFLLSLKR